MNTLPAGSDDADQAESTEQTPQQGPESGVSATGEGAQEDDILNSPGLKNMQQRLQNLGLNLEEPDTGDKEEQGA